MRVRTNLEESRVKEASVAEAKIRSHTLKHRRPFWVKSAILAGCRSLPIYPDEQTLSVSVGMSQRCQKATLLTFQRKLKYLLTLTLYFNIH